MTLHGPLLHFVRAARRARFRASHPLSSVKHGKDFIVGKRIVLTRGVELHVGDRVSIGPGLTCMANARVGDDVMISANVGMIGDDHPFDDETKTLYQQPPRSPATITIEGDNLIGYGATLLGNITVGQGAIVAAASLVNRDVPGNSIVAGVPAKVVGWRRPQAGDQA